MSFVRSTFESRHSAFRYKVASTCALRTLNNDNRVSTIGAVHGRGSPGRAKRGGAPLPHAHPRLWFRPSDAVAFPDRGAARSMFRSTEALHSGAGRHTARMTAPAVRCG